SSSAQKGGQSDGPFVYKGKGSTKFKPKKLIVSKSSSKGDQPRPGANRGGEEGSSTIGGASPVSRSIRRLSRLSVAGSAPVLAEFERRLSGRTLGRKHSSPFELFCRESWARLRAKDVLDWESDRVASLVLDRWRDDANNEEHSGVVHSRLKGEYEKAMKEYKRELQQKGSSSSKHRGLDDKQGSGKTEIVERKIEIDKAEDDEEGENAIRSVRELAHARYQRNHRLINEIFSPDVVFPTRPVTSQSHVDNLKATVKRLTAHKDKLLGEIERMEESYISKRQAVLSAIDLIMNMNKVEETAQGEQVVPQTTQASPSPTPASPASPMSHAPIAAGMAATASPAAATPSDSAVPSPSSAPSADPEVDSVMDVVTNTEEQQHAGFDSSTAATAEQVPITSEVTPSYTEPGTFAEDASRASLDQIVPQAEEQPMEVDAPVAGDETASEIPHEVVGNAVDESQLVVQQQLPETVVETSANDSKSEQASA
ncbi:unnamed protein product, partial [Notodromas monacha]